MKALQASTRTNLILLGILVPVTVVVAFLSTFIGPIVDLLVIAIVLFVTFFMISYRYPRYNIVAVLAGSYLLPLFVKVSGMYEVPFGIVIEALNFTMLVTLLLNKRLSGAKTLPGILLLVWIAYEFIELANPFAGSRVASFLYIRTLIPFVILFFVVYSSVDSKRDIRTFIVAWMILGALSGIYGLIQEFFGLPSYDYNYLTRDEVIYNLMFTWGRLRKFSFFFNPSEFGMLCSISGVAGFILFFMTSDRLLKILGMITFICCSWALIYTGSRTSMVILPVGFVMFALITLNRKVLIGVGFIFLCGTAMVLRPSGGAMFVMATAFSADDDPSMNLRMLNRQTIRSYIVANPIGYGLGATGSLGKKYTPGTLIGQFDTDSEFVRVAVETGWLGLFLYAGMLGTIFIYCARILFRTRDPEWKMVLTMGLSVLYMIMVAQYAQEIFVSIVMITLMAGFAGVMTKVGQLTNPAVEAEAIEE